MYFYSKKITRSSNFKHLKVSDKQVNLFLYIKVFLFTTMQQNSFAYFKNIFLKVLLPQLIYI